ncbi:SDR family NAD(P)-dependent oxidoreductase [Mycobacterium sp. Z3061]|uniref:SDR family NAD(P)-dependent oxidoreductase n=1 Tax=Mycobacterium sp. Z3061 TaxID=3073562 RepID=UPI0028774262|nr:SDR family NAD(P)-dependent oxidoreductase [Mycobacterium sp. Z3061]
MEGKHVLITGASSGIGAALARAMAARGATVGVVARREDRLADVLADCRASSPDSVMWVADLADGITASRLALQAWHAMSGIDILVNNAAIPKRRSVAALKPFEVENVMQVNFIAPMRLTLALLPRMLARRAGTIINVSSVAGRLGIATESAYCASKFALCGWTEAMAIDLADTGVSVKLIQPGPVDTEIWDQPDNEPPAYTGPKVTPEEVAEGIIGAMDSDRFEHYLPDLKAVVDAKNADLDAFIAGMTQP